MTADSPDGRAADMFGLMAELYPLCRSITGDGVRETLRAVGRHLPLDIVEVPTGTRVFDWTVPPEWNIHDAAVVAPDGRRVVDFRASNLHVVGYSEPVSARMTLDELRPHLHTLPDQPDLVPYRTSYYARRWGFCLSQRQLDALDDATYDVVVDSELTDGSLTYGECVLPGATTDEVLLTCHVCHPSLANDNLSGIAALTGLGRQLARRDRRLTYRLLFIPGTIGSLTWLSRNEHTLDRIVAGLTVAGVADPGAFTYKRSRHGDTWIDRTMEVVLRDAEPDDGSGSVIGRRLFRHRMEEFSPYGYDERQFCSPGFDLPVGCLMRTPHNTYPQYHTSADDLDFVSQASLTGTLDLLDDLVEALEGDRRYVNRSPRGEPQLGRRGLYPSMGGPTARTEQLAMLWVLNLSDGRPSLLDIADRSGMPFAAIHAAAEKLAATDLLDVVDAASAATDVSAGRRLADLVPGGAHTYAKGDDQYPVDAPTTIVRGRGCRVWDADGNEFVEYGMGLRAVTLGHAYPPVVDRVRDVLPLGTNFTRPAAIEVEAAERVLGLLGPGRMVKFAKNGSDVTTAATRLARAVTGRERIAICRDQPFFSTDDWFIGAGPMRAGVPKVVQDLTVGFAYGDVADLERVFAEHPGDIACVVMEAARETDPPPGYLQAVQQLCRREGAVWVLDEMITGFRWHDGGAQAEYGLDPDLSAFGKGLGNGFAVAALVGRPELMRRGGLDTDEERVFLLSTTNGAESVGLAAAIGVVDTYERQPVIERLHRQGRRLADGVDEVVRRHGVAEHLHTAGRASNLVYRTLDPAGRPSQPHRTLFMQELIRNGVLAPSFVVSYSHDDAAIDRTVAAVDAAAAVYARALEDGADRHLHGRSVEPAIRRFA